MTQQSSPETIDPALKRVQMLICTACLDGIGEECHTPGCAMFLHRVDIPFPKGAYTEIPDAAATPRGAPEPLSLQAVREDERMACWKIAEAERASAAVDKQAWLVAFDIANAIKARGYDG
jgi:hypothetical protein